MIALGLLRRLVEIQGAEYVLELAPGGLSLRRKRTRVPVAVMPWHQVLELGNRNVLLVLRAKVRAAARARKRRRKARRPYKRRRSSSRRRR